MKKNTNNIIYIIIGIIIIILIYLAFFKKTVTGIVINKDFIKMYETYSEKLEVEVKPEGVDAVLVWTSSNPSVAMVDDTGLVKGISPGIAKIIVSTEDEEIVSSCIVSVLKKEVKEIILDNKEININVGEEANIKATINPSQFQNDPITWTSSDINIASVDENGKVTGISGGIAEIKAELLGGEATSLAYIGTKMTEIKFENNEVTIPKNKKQKLELIITPENAINEEITWESSDKDTVEIDNEGNITAIYEGVATITATTKYSNLKATCEVVVGKEQFEVVFKELEKKETKENGDKLGELPTMTKDTYKFLGWYTALNGGKKVTENTIVESDMTLYPHWEKLYIIALDASYNSYQTAVMSDTPTLKYRIIRYNNSDVVLIWVADAAKQLKLGLASGDAVGVGPAPNILASVPGNKTLVAVNGGLFSGVEPVSKVVIQDGRVVRNKGNAGACMGITNKGDLVDCTHRSANDILSMGVLNNFSISHSIQPTVGDGTKVSALRTQICQVDKNNFVMVSTSSMRTSEAAKIAYGFSGNKCSTVFNLDGGGSRKLYYRSPGGSLTNRYDTGRAITDMLIFAEQ